MDELAELPAFQQENEPLINCCPVCGEILEVSDKLNTLVHLSLCFDEGTGNQVMTGGLLINSLLMGMNLLTVNFMSCLLLWWMFKLSEWAHFSSYDVGLNSGSSASHILDSDSDFEVFELFDPAATGKVVGRISLSCSVEDPMETEKNFARCILAIVDYNEDGKLSFSEFSDLIKAFGNQVADNKF
nr:phosphatidylserine decarboxylase proenzyme 2-like isoform X4 [Populus alba]